MDSMPGMSTMSPKPMTHGESHHSMAQMHMTFFSGTDFMLLFSGWVPKTAILYILTLLAVFVFAVLHEWISRVRSMQAMATEKDYSSSRESARPRARLALEVLVYTGYTITGYSLMLMVMSFNVGVVVAVILGSSFGFFLCRVFRNNTLSSEKPSA